VSGDYRNNYYDIYKKYTEFHIYFRAYILK